MGNTKLVISPSTAFIRRDWTFHFFMGWLIFFTFICDFIFIHTPQAFFIIDRSRWFCYLFSKSCSSVYFLHSFCWLFTWLFSSFICFDTMCAFGGIYFISSDIYIAFLSLISSDPLLILSRIHFLASDLSFVAYSHYPLRFICSSLFYVFCTCTWGDISSFSSSTCTFLYLTCS